MWRGRLSRRLDPLLQTCGRRQSLDKRGVLMYQPIQQTNTASSVGISLTRRTPRRFLGSSLLAAVILPFLLSVATGAFGGSATWNLNPTSGDWNTATNWTPETVPNGPGQ